MIRRAMLGAKSARDATAHRLYYKKAREAMGYRSKKTYDEGLTDEEADQRGWCYVWQSDNTAKSGRKNNTLIDDGYPGRPTIQHGYARGVVALSIQIVDVTIAVISEHQGWRHAKSCLPVEWFQPTISGGPCRGMIVWNGEALLRR